MDARVKPAHDESGITTLGMNADAPSPGSRIWLCADDYGIAPGVNEAIRRLIARGRINATSIMTVAPHFNAEAATALVTLNAGEPRAAIGLHLTLTAPFAPASEGFAPLREGRFLPLGAMMQRSLARRLPSERLAAEIGTQLRIFRETLGRLPDFVDGPQHVHLFPQVRDTVLKTIAEAAPNAWVRQCGRAPATRRDRSRKALVLDLLSLRFRRKAARRGIRFNPAFAGAYAFTGQADFAALFPRFLTGMPDGGLIMCHPGFVDAALEKLDPLTTLREHEFTFFDSDAFPRILAEHGVALARPSGA
jgi:predicted glycoside hydrolase/deacetylase ChbG (UPF0249 family)